MALTAEDVDELWRIRRTLDWWKLRLSLLRAEMALKAYNPNQHRTPAGNGDESGRWARESGSTPFGADKNEDERRISRDKRIAFLAPYLVEEYNMGPRTICTYQGWPGRFAEIFPRGECPKKYLPGYGPIA